jgi:PAS domain S-box-containing protein
MTDARLESDAVSSRSPSAGAAPRRSALRHPAAGWTAAAAAPLGALVLCLALEPLLAPNFHFVFLAAVMVGAWAGGLRPGLAATLLSALLINFVFTAPRFAFALGDPGDAAKLGMFVVLGAMVSALSQRRLDAQRDALALADDNARLALARQEQAVEIEQQAEEAQSLNTELELQAEEMQALNVELEQQIEQSTALRLELEAGNDDLRAAIAEADAARERLARVLETMAEGVLLVDDGGRITYANAGAARILAARPADLVGVRYDDRRFAPALPDGAPFPVDEAPVAEVLRTGQPVLGREVAMRAGVATHFLRVSAAPLRAPGGAVDAVVVSFDDVTADREAEEALRESEARFRAMADSAPVLIWMADAEGLRAYVNRPWLEFTGRALPRELGNGWAEGVHPDDYQRCLTTYLSSFEARRAFRMEYRLRRGDGEYRWLLDQGVPRFTPDGSFAGFIGTCVDITERREAEEQQRFLAEAGTVLASSLDYHETLRQVCRLAVPAMADFCIVDLLDDDGRVRRVEAVHADRQAEPLMAVLRRHVPDTSPGSPHPLAEVLRVGAPRVMNDLASGALEDFVSADEEHRRAVARLAPSALMVVPLVARGRILGAVSFVTTESGRRYDGSELVRGQELARRAAFAIDNARLYERAVEANRAKADFLAVMSHELRTPLNAIIGYTDLFLYGIPAPLPDPMRPQMERVRSAARHLLELIEEILTFARLEAGQEEVRPAAAGAGAVAQEAAALVEPLALERGIDFRVEGPAPDFQMLTDARKARQILLNLLSNAVKFTESGGATLTVARDGDDAVFAVADTGIGIEPAALERIFEPFWQVDQGLQREHGGSGLGLSVARQLARLLGGDVTARSTPGEGSTFTLRLPIRYESA